MTLILLLQAAGKATQDELGGGGSLVILVLVVAIASFVYLLRFMSFIILKLNRLLRIVKGKSPLTDSELDKLVTDAYSIKLRHEEKRQHSESLWSGHGGVPRHQSEYLQRDLQRARSEALELYRLAAEQGNARAQYALGTLYCKGEGVERDLAEAARWFRLAADQGLAQAQYTVGWCYEQGDGVELDLAEAARWYRLAADQGLNKAEVASARLSKEML